MLTRITYLLKYYLYWILYFITLKLVFLIYHHNKSFEIFDLWGKILSKGLRLDLSASGYIMLIPIVLVLFFHFFPSRLPHQIIKIYNYFILAIISLLAASDLGLYNEWGYRMDVTPLLYLAKPKEAFASISFLFFLNHLIIATALISVFVYIFRIVFSEKSFEDKSSWWSFSGIFLFLLCLFLPIRGGIGVATINVSSAYFSENNFANHAAINLPWNIGYSLTNLEATNNPFDFYSERDAIKLASAFTKKEGTHQQVLTTTKPNILLIILESFTANATGCLNGQIQVTPNLDSLAREGILFSSLYASGDRTDKGMLAIFSGYPSQPTTSIIKFPDKTQNLPALPKTLRTNGYKTYFYYGGDIDFANYKSYLMNAGIEHFISQNDFPASEKKSKWGVPDEFLFARVLKDIETMDGPYFLSLFTLSSHAPYDVPMEPFLEGKSDEIKFCNSVYYSDHHLGKFIDELESKKLLDNTLVIMIADHGNVWPGNLTNHSPLKYHIPMVWYGGVVRNTNTIVPVISSQTDLAATLLAQLNVNSDDYVFGKNIFSSNPSQQIVYSINNGFGYISDSLEFYYNRLPDHAIVEKGDLSQERLMEAKAYYQLLYNDFLKR